MLKELFNNQKYLICAGLSTFSLVLSSISTISISNSVKELSTDLEPISKWANTQNDCITKTFRIDGKNTQGIPSKVWSCNGGGN
tara:strand:- start:180 stop:431 length:252 start_codon:yes stop_codon:yes gene_type:complete